MKRAAMRIRRKQTPPGNRPGKPLEVALRSLRGYDTIPIPYQETFFRAKNYPRAL